MRLPARGGWQKKKVFSPELHRALHFTQPSL
jgi:hypothetical protein